MLSLLLPGLHHHLQPAKVDMVYTFTYTDCSGNSHVWTYTYTIDIPDFVLPADGASTVNCPADAVAPTPPML
jgi:hypothetical protein